MIFWRFTAEFNGQWRGACGEQVSFSRPGGLEHSAARCGVSIPPDQSKLIVTFSSAGETPPLGEIRIARYWIHESPARDLSALGESKEVPWPFEPTHLACSS